MVTHTNSLNRQKILLVIESSGLSRVTKFINDEAIADWRNVIQIFPLENKKLPRSKAKEYSVTNSYELIKESAEKNFELVIVNIDVPLDLELLQKEELPLKRVTSFKTLLKVLGDQLKDRNLHWHSHAMNEWNKSSIRCQSPELMVQQFAELGYPQIGKQLLKGLRVVTEADLRSVFTISDAEKIGHKVVHAFIQDDEPGSSSIAIKNVLEHLYPLGDVVKINIENLAEIESLEADVVYVYEDGLWSGVELVNRLNAICKTEFFRNSNIQLHFRYGITSDAGLIAARLFAKRERIGRLQFAAAKPENHYTFLKPGIDTCFQDVSDCGDNVIREALDKEIEPYAFRCKADWNNDPSQAMEVCLEIGKQLIRPFLERREKEKNGFQTQVTEEKVTRWGLGALGFASTVVFASSVPKPVLPLFWLDGQVSFNGKSIDWRPLFWDTRRTGKVDN